RPCTTLSPYTTLFRSLVLLAKYLDRSADLNLLVFLLFRTEQRDRPTWLRQTVGIQVAAIIGYKLLNPCRRNLRNQVTDLLLISARAEWLHNIPMITFLLQLHFTGRCFQYETRHLRGV